MEFRTLVEPTPSGKKIRPESFVSMIGSCFVENIGEYLLRHKFRVDLNPFGVIYNPVAVADCIVSLVERRVFGPADMLLHDGLWHSWAHHGRFSHPDPYVCQQQINDRIVSSSEFLQKADFLFITLGTSKVYRLNQTGEIVGNCHKLSASAFTHEQLSVSAVTGVLAPALERLFDFNPGLQIVLTVSPVRHWKDGAVANMHSKATLLVAIHELCDRFPALFYFPSYEIVMDELRDYRFYAADMLHITDQAVTYIARKFEACFFSDRALTFRNRASMIVNGLSHRPLHPESDNYLRFREQLQKQIDDFESDYPGVSFSG